MLFGRIIGFLIAARGAAVLYFGGSGATTADQAAPWYEDGSLLHDLSWLFVAKFSAALSSGRFAVVSLATGVLLMWFCRRAPKHAR